MATNKYSDSATFKKADDIVDRKNNKDKVIVLMKMDDSSSFFKIRGIAAEVWEHISQGDSIGPIQEKLEKTYDVKSETLRTDIENLIDKLIDMNIISTI